MEIFQLNGLFDVNWNHRIPRIAKSEKVFHKTSQTCSINLTPRLPQM